MPWIGASDPWRLVLAMASAKYLTVLYGKHGNFSAAGRTVLLCGGVVAAVNPYRNSLAASPVVWHCQGVEGVGRRSDRGGRSSKPKWKKKKHTTPGIRWSSPTQLLVWPSQRLSVGCLGSKNGRFGVWNWKPLIQAARNAAIRFKPDASVTINVTS